MKYSQQKETLQSYVIDFEQIDMEILSNKKKQENRIRTSQYTKLSFLPVNFVQQIIKPSNVYFILIAVMQTIPQISNSGGWPVILGPLSYVIVISMIKDFLEDLKRQRRDEIENNKTVSLLKDGQETTVVWKELKKGDIVKLYRDDQVPADMVLISSSQKGLCYVETKNLDGETNLKRLEIPYELNKLYQDNSYQDFISYAKIEYDLPNQFIYSFNGQFSNQNLNVILSQKNLVLRGCVIRNAEYIIGIVVYTGHDNKILQNMVKSKKKLSQLEKLLHSYIIYIFLVLLSISFLLSLLYLLWLKDNKEQHKYLGIQYTSYAYIFFVKGFSWVLIFSNLIPISLIVTMDYVKFLQAVMAMRSKFMTSSQGVKMIVNSSNLNEELGQVEYVFTDKTGTLTQNKMVFKNIIVNGQVFPQQSQEQNEKENKWLQLYDNVEFNDDEFIESLQSDQDNFSAVELLSVCHSVQVYNEQYQAESPDELAFVQFAKQCGVEFISWDEQNNIIVSIQGKQRVYKVLDTIEFDSYRKRMSVIIQNEQQEIFILTKGADNKIIDIIKDKETIQTYKTINLINELSLQGFWTFLLANKKITHQEYQQFKDTYIPQTKLSKFLLKNHILEKDFNLLGFCCLEDKLQNHVPETISLFKRADIKVCILTGDKLESTISSAIQSNILDPSLPQIIIDDMSKQQLFDQIQSYIKQQKNEKDFKFQTLFTGDCLDHICNSKTLKKIFVELITQSHCIIGCRLTPSQKALIVHMIQKSLPNISTLAIGDGANDTLMLQQASVGIGLYGSGHWEAATIADFAIGEFYVLKNLLFGLGREYYRKNSTYFLYSFWRTNLIMMSLFFYGLLSGNYSGFNIYNSNMRMLTSLLFSVYTTLVFAFFDKEAHKKELIHNPVYYKHGKNQKYFNGYVFTQWYLKGIIQAFLIVYILMLFFGQQNQDGSVVGIYQFGTMVFYFNILTITLQIFLISNSFSIFILFVIGFSFGSLMLTIYILSNNKGNIMYMNIWQMFSQSVTIHIHVVIFTVFTFLDGVWQLVCKILFHNRFSVTFIQRQDEYQVELKRLMSTTARQAPSLVAQNTFGFNN